MHFPPSSRCFPLRASIRTDGTNDHSAHEHVPHALSWQPLPFEGSTKPRGIHVFLAGRCVYVISSGPHLPPRVKGEWLPILLRGQRRNPLEPIASIPSILFVCQEVDRHIFTNYHSPVYPGRADRSRERGTRLGGLEIRGSSIKFSTERNSWRDIKLGVILFAPFWQTYWACKRI